MELGQEIRLLSESNKWVSVKKMKYFVLFSYPFDPFIHLHNILLWICISYFAFYKRNRLSRLKYIFDSLIWSTWAYFAYEESGIC
jgi:hypothetical protein